MQRKIYYVHLSPLRKHSFNLFVFSCLNKSKNIPASSIGLFVLSVSAACISKESVSTDNTGITKNLQIFSLRPLVLSHTIQLAETLPTLSLFFFFVHLDHLKNAYSQVCTESHICFQLHQLMFQTTAGCTVRSKTETLKRFFRENYYK